MIEDGFFSKILQPLVRRKSESDTITETLRFYIKKDFSIVINGVTIKINTPSATYKRELLLHKEEIEQKLEEVLSKKYKVLFR